MVASGPITLKVGELLEEAADIIIAWLAEAGIELAPEKTELILPIRKRTHNMLEIMIKGRRVVSNNSVKYLGVHLDQQLNFGVHAASVAHKADSTVRSLTAIMPNVKGPRHQTRKLLAAVPLSILLYGAPVWSGYMTAGGIKTLMRCQRRIALHVTAAYRTISGEAVLVLAGMPPVDLLVAERAEVHRGKQSSRNMLEVKAEVKRNLATAWQGRWSTSEKGAWIRRHIPDITPWLGRKLGEMTFHLTQAISEHGCFPAYLKRFGLLPTEECWFYDSKKDDALHTIFHCEGWWWQRANLFTEVGTITPENVIAKIVSDKRTWDAFATYVTSVFRVKEAEERRQQTGQQL